MSRRLSVVLALVLLLGTGANAAKARTVEDLSCNGLMNFVTDQPAYVQPKRFLVRGSGIKIWVNYGALNGWKGEPRPMFVPGPMPSLAFRLDNGPTATFGADPKRRDADGTIGFYGLKPGTHRIEIGIVVAGHVQQFNAYCIRTPANFTATGY